jgi:hypothetical protein
MNDKDKQTMELHGVTFAPRNVYFYKEYKYDRIDARRVRKTDGDS